MSRTRVLPRPEPEKPAPPPADAWWNNIRRAWLVESEHGPVALDPQPPPPPAPTHVDHVPPAVRVRL